MLRGAGLLKATLLTCLFICAIYFALRHLVSSGHINLKNYIGELSDSTDEVANQPKNACGVSRSCPAGHITFKMNSGAASVVGPKMCINDAIVMSSVKNNVGRGLNIALIDGKTGKDLRTDFFDLWAGDVKPLISFLKTIEDGTIVMIATFDDSSSKLTPEARQMITDLGSSHIESLGFRDNWVFVGAKGIQSKSPFEQHIKSDAKSNKYDGWPEVLEMEGCIPQKFD